MGGPIEKGQLANFSWELPISQVRFELKSNVVPIGKIKSGIHIHRALLFKVSIQTPNHLNRQMDQEFEDTKGVIRIRKSKKDRQHNDQKKKYK
jgi:hypothetical protein